MIFFIVHDRRRHPRWRSAVVARECPGRRTHVAGSLKSGITVTNDSDVGFDRRGCAGMCSGGSKLGRGRTRQGAKAIEGSGRFAPHAVGHHPAVGMPDEIEFCYRRECRIRLNGGHQCLQERDIIFTRVHHVIVPGESKRGSCDRLSLGKDGHNFFINEPLFALWEKVVVRRSGVVFNS